jgi:mono/diheme cytochrome c family protein
VLGVPRRRCEGPPKEDFLKPAPNLVDDQADHGTSDGEVFTVIKNGVPPELVMDGWGERLSDTEIWSIVTYLKDLARKK